LPLLFVKRLKNPFKASYQVIAVAAAVGGREKEEK
jgi:hypothetical protein